MALRMFDFRCDVGHVHERLVESAVRFVLCQTCGRPANRLIAAPRCQLDGCSGDFPSAAMKWEANRESHMKVEKKNQENHGTYK